MRAGWEYKKLGEVCDVLNGLWTGKKEPFLNVAVIRNANFTKECTLNLSNVAYIDVEERQFKSRELKYGDIIIEKSGGSDKQPVGRPVLFDIQDRGYSFSNFTATLRIKEESLLSSKFLHKVLLSQYNQGFTRRLQSKTTGLHNLDMKSYLKSIIPIPPIPQQRLIVSELDEINSLIALKREQLKKYDELAQSLFYEMFGDPVENEKGWEVSSLSSVCSTITDGSHNPPKGGEESSYLMLSSKNIKDGTLNFDEPRYLTEEEYIIENQRTKVQIGDILLTIVGTIGRCCLFDSSKNIVFQRSVAILKPKDCVISLFLMNQLRMLKETLDKESKGVAQKGIYLKQLGKMCVVIPPLSLQHLFALRIEQIEEQKKQVTAALAKLETLLASRMQYWFE